MTTLYVHPGQSAYAYPSTLIAECNDHWFAITAWTIRTLPTRPIGLTDDHRISPDLHRLMRVDTQMTRIAEMAA